MGQIINVRTGDTDLPVPLTETEQRGFRTGKYLADGPAVEAVADDETVTFVVTNRTYGIAITDDTTEHVTPDQGYQTVVVITDRRILVLVGMEHGDRQFTLDISEITEVDTAAGGRSAQLTIRRADGTAWEITTEASGLAGVANYLRNKSKAQQTVRNVRRTTKSIRSLFGNTVDTAKSLGGSRVNGLLPAQESVPLEAPTGGAAEESSTESATSGGETGTDRPDTETAISTVTTALAKTDWRARSAQSESPFDLLAEREDELVGIVIHCPADEVISRNIIKRCGTIAGAAGTDTVLLATTATIRDTDVQLAIDLGVRLRNVETLSDTTDPPTIEVVTEMVSKELEKRGWTVRANASGPFDMRADHGDELVGIIVHSPEDGTVRRSIEHCDDVAGAAGTDAVVLATTGTVREADEQLASELGVWLLESESLGRRHVTDIIPE